MPLIFSDKDQIGQVANLSSTTDLVSLHLHCRRGHPLEQSHLLRCVAAASVASRIFLFGGGTFQTLRPCRGNPTQSSNSRRPATIAQFGIRTRAALLRGENRITNGT